MGRMGRSTSTRRMTPASYGCDEGGLSPLRTSGVLAGTKGVLLAGTKGVLAGTKGVLAGTKGVLLAGTKGVLAGRVPARGSRSRLS